MMVARVVSALGRRMSTSAFGINVALFGTILLVSFVPSVDALCSYLSFSPQYSFDRLWLLLYVVGAVAIGLLLWVKRGRLLLMATGIVLLLLVGISIIKMAIGLPLVVLVWLLVLAIALGDRVLRICVKRLHLMAIERILFSVALGLGLIGLVVLALAIIHVLHSAVLFLLLAALSAVLLPSSISEVRTKVRWCGPSLRSWRLSDHRLLSVVVASASICISGAYVWAIAPAVHHDALNYHLAVPQTYVDVGGLVEIPEEFRSHWAHSAEMLYALGLALVGQPLPALIHFASGLFTSGLILALGQRIGSPRAGLLGALLFLALPITTWESGTAYIDLMVTLYTFAATYAVVAWWLAVDDAWLVVGGMFIGLALGTKLNAVLFLIPAIVFMMGVLMASHGFQAPLGSRALALVVPAVVLAAPWFALEWLRTGNPVFPFFNAYFRSTKWPLENTFFNFSTFGIGHSIADLLRLPWALAVNASAFGEGTNNALAGLTLVALPWTCLLAPTRTRRVMLVIASLVTVSMVFWFVTGQYLRYLMPATPMMTLLAGLNVNSMWTRASTKSCGKRLLFAGLIVLLSWLTLTRLTVTSWFFSIPERYPYRLVLGLESSEEFLSRSIRSYDALRYLAQQSEGDRGIKVFSVGNEYRLYAGRAAIYDIIGSPLAGMLASLPPGGLLASTLAEHGFTHILVDQNRLDVVPSWSQVGAVNTSFLQQFAHLEFARNRVYVFGLFPPETGTLSPRADNLLHNASFEVFGDDGLPFSWLAFGTPRVDTSGVNGRSGRIALSVTQEDGLYQRVVVIPGRLYSFGGYVRADYENQSAWLQVMWMDQNLQFLGGEIVAVPCSHAWEWKETSATCPEGAHYAQFYVRAADGSQVWFDDVAMLLNGPG